MKTTPEDLSIAAPPPPSDAREDIAKAVRDEIMRQAPDSWHAWLEDGDTDAGDDPHCSRTKLCVQYSPIIDTLAFADAIMPVLALTRPQDDGVQSEQAPIPMLLFCPRCHVQHIDEPDERTPDWDNPPHRSHLCHACGCIWRPADVATNGVAAISTVGKADNWQPHTTQPEPLKADDGLREAVAAQFARIKSVETALANGTYYADDPECHPCYPTLVAARQIIENAWNDRIVDLSSGVRIKVDPGERSDWPEKSAEEISDIIRAAYATGARRHAAHNNSAIDDAAYDYMMSVGPLVMADAALKATPLTQGPSSEPLVKAGVEYGALRESVKTILARCEALEDEASDNLATVLANNREDTHEVGFWRGQKSTAKSLRNHLHDLTRAALSASTPAAEEG